MNSHLTIDMLNWPEALAILRLELAKMLRLEAESEAHPDVARRLLEIAASFEAGVIET